MMADMSNASVAGGDQTVGYFSPTREHDLSGPSIASIGEMTHDGSLDLGATTMESTKIGSASVDVSALSEASVRSEDMESIEITRLPAGDMPTNAKMVPGRNNSRAPTEDKAGASSSSSKNNNNNNNQQQQQTPVAAHNKTARVEAVDADATPVAQHQPPAHVAPSSLARALAAVPVPADFDARSADDTVPAEVTVVERSQASPPDAQSPPMSPIKGAPHSPTSLADEDDDEEEEKKAGDKVKEKTSTDDSKPAAASKRSSQADAGMSLRIYSGKAVKVPGAHYKSILATPNMRAHEAVAVVLERYGLSNKPEEFELHFVKTHGEGRRGSSFKLFGRHKDHHILGNDDIPYMISKQFDDPSFRFELHRRKRRSSKELLKKKGSQGSNIDLGATTVSTQSSPEKAAAAAAAAAGSSTPNSNPPSPEKKSRRSLRRSLRRSSQNSRQSSRVSETTLEDAQATAASLSAQPDDADASTRGLVCKTPQKAPYLVQRTGKGAQPTISCLGEGTTLLGSGDNGAQVDVRVPGDDVRPIHCKITAIGESVVLTPFPGADVLINDALISEPILLPKEGLLVLGSHRNEPITFANPFGAADIKVLDPALALQTFTTGASAAVTKAPPTHSDSYIQGQQAALDLTEVAAAVADIDSTANTTMASQVIDSLAVETAHQAVTDALEVERTRTQATRVAVVVAAAPLDAEEEEKEEEEEEEELVEEMAAAKAKKAAASTAVAAAGSGRSTPVSQRSPVEVVTQYMRSQPTPPPPTLNLEEEDLADAVQPVAFANTVDDQTVDEGHVGHDDDGNSDGNDDSLEEAQAGPETIAAIQVPQQQAAALRTISPGGLSAVSERSERTTSAMSGSSAMTTPPPPPPETEHAASTRHWGDSPTRSPTKAAFADEDKTEVAVEHHDDEKEQEEDEQVDEEEQPVVVNEPPRTAEPDAAPKMDMLASPAPPRPPSTSPPVTPAGEVASTGASAVAPAAAAPITLQVAGSHAEADAETDDVEAEVEVDVQQQQAVVEQEKEQEEPLAAGENEEEREEEKKEEEGGDEEEAQAKPADEKEPVAADEEEVEEEKEEATQKPSTEPTSEKPASATPRLVDNPVRTLSGKPLPLPKVRSRTANVAASPAPAPAVAKKPTVKAPRAEPIAVAKAEPKPAIDDKSQTPALPVPKTPSAPVTTKEPATKEPATKKLPKPVVATSATTAAASTAASNADDAKTKEDKEKEKTESTSSPAPEEDDGSEYTASGLRKSRRISAATGELRAEASTSSSSRTTASSSSGSTASMHGSTASMHGLRTTGLLRAGGVELNKPTSSSTRTPTRTAVTDHGLRSTGLLRGVEVRREPSGGSRRTAASAGPIDHGLRSTGLLQAGRHAHTSPTSRRRENQRESSRKRPERMDFKDRLRVFAEQEKAAAEAANGSA